MPIPPFASQTHPTSSIRACFGKHGAYSSHPKSQSKCTVATTLLSKCEWRLVRPRVVPFRRARQERQSPRQSWRGWLQRACPSYLPTATNVRCGCLLWQTKLWIEEMLPVKRWIQSLAKKHFPVRRTNAIRKVDPKQIFAGTQTTRVAIPLGSKLFTFKSMSAIGTKIKRTKK